MALRILGDVLLAIGAAIVIWSLRHKGLSRPTTVNVRLLAGLAVAAIGAHFVFG